MTKEYFPGYIESFPGYLVSAAGVRARQRMAILAGSLRGGARRAGASPKSDSAIEARRGAGSTGPGRARADAAGNAAAGRRGESREAFGARCGA